MRKWTDHELRGCIKASIPELRYLCCESVMPEAERERSLWLLSRNWAKHSDIHESEGYDKLSCLLFDRGRMVGIQWALVHGQLSDCSGQAVCFAYQLVSAFNSVGELSTCENKPEEYRAAIVMGWHAVHQVTDFLDDFQADEQRQASQQCEQSSPWGS